jgi:RimJ/RimL family protein N-acetyltransferase
MTSRRDRAPRIETASLVLDGHVADDVDACFALWSDPKVTRHFGGRPLSRQESWFTLQRYCNLWPRRGYGYWTVRQAATGRYMGDVGFTDYHATVFPFAGDVPEIGCAFMPWSHGKGYAREAMTAALAWLDTTTALERCFCMMATKNIPAVRLARQVGFGPPEPVDVLGETALLMWRHCPRAGGLG